MVTAPPGSSASVTILVSSPHVEHHARTGLLRLRMIQTSSVSTVITVLHFLISRPRPGVCGRATKARRHEGAQRNEPSQKLHSSVGPPTELAAGGCHSNVTSDRNLDVPESFHASLLATPTV